LLLASLHVGGESIINAPIIRKNCSVKFYSYVPTNLQDHPYIVIISKGVHSHPPPPPTKTPVDIVSELQKIINNENVIDLTMRRLLTGKFFILTLLIIIKL